jgi:hypothetical protein
MEATVILRETPCRMRLQARWCRRQSTNLAETIHEHYTKEAILDKATWTLTRVRVPW